MLSDKITIETDWVRSRERSRPFPSSTAECGVVPIVLRFQTRISGNGNVEKQMGPTASSA
jgi:hypothetical protein